VVGGHSGHKNRLRHATHLADRLPDQAPTVGPRAWLANSEFFTEWTSDSNGYDPDAAKVELVVPGIDALVSNDFRICMFGSDGGPGKKAGPPQCTPWASQGGGVSPLATDNNALDPDYYKIGMQTREWPGTDTKPVDVRIGLRGVDHAGGDVRGAERFTPWASLGGGWSDWASDSNTYDPDGYIVNLDLRHR
jgi:hypothetical protein